MSTRTSQSILIVDDDANLRLALSDFLKFEGFTVSTASSGEAALEKLETLRPDLIILDMSMPGMGGLEFLKRITADTGQTRFPVLVLTARANMRGLFEDLRVDGFLSKPCEPKGLITEIQAILSNVERRGGSVSVEREGPCVVVCMGLEAAASRVGMSLESNGVEVHLAEPGLALVGDAVRQNPSCIVLGPHSHGMSMAAIATILAQMPQTAGIPIVVTARDSVDGVEPQAWPDDRVHDLHVASLDAETIVKSVLSVLEIQSDPR